MISTILEIVLAVFKAIPVIGGLFKDNVEKDVQDIRKESHKEMEEYKRTGRPPDDGT